MKKYKVTVYTWGQPPYVITVEAKNYAVFGNRYCFFTEPNLYVAEFPTDITSVELIG